MRCEDGELRKVSDGYVVREGERGFESEEYGRVNL